MTLEIWDDFEHDPRSSEHAALRAADRDRDVVLRVLGDAYAEGRIDRDEFDQRSEVVSQTRTLGELPAVISDLVPVTGRAGTRSLTTPDIQARAVAKFAKQRREALWALISASLICWVIWTATSVGGNGFNPQFPWPLFVMLGTGINVGRVVFMREDIIASEQRRLERKQAKKELPPADE